MKFKFRYLICLVTLLLFCNNVYAVSQSCPPNYVSLNDNDYHSCCRVGSTYDWTTNECTNALSNETASPKKKLLCENDEEVVTYNTNTQNGLCCPVGTE